MTAPHRHSLGDFRPPGFGAATDVHGQSPIPMPSTGLYRAGSQGMASPDMRVTNGFDFSRSPPNNKNTSHVPCKFFRSGNCQAGNACPFSHAIEPQSDVPCKYFAKGNCKFGPKCALAHVLPDGRRVNRPPYMQPDMPFQIPQSRPSTMSSFADSLPHPTMPVPTGGRVNGMGQEDFFYHHHGQQKQPYSVQVTAIDAAYASPPGSNWGSPPTDNHARHTLSPTIRALDAQLPASFDSQAFHILHVSAPALLTSTAFGNLNHMARAENRGQPPRYESLGSPPRYEPLGSSPPNLSDEVFPRRILHSESRSKPQMISSSLPVPHLDDYDESLLPINIRDLWAPRTRDGRRSLEVDEDQPFSSRRHSLSGFASPADSKVGSPSNGSPMPSRFGQFFAQRHNREDSKEHELGHVGSPLRTTSMHLDSASRPALSRPRSRDASPFGLSSPPNIALQRSGGPSMLSLQFGSLRVTSDSDGNSLRPGLLRNTSGPNTSHLLNATNLTAEQRERAKLYRVVSNTSISRNDTIIEEESELCLFSMEEEEEQRLRRAEGVEAATDVTETAANAGTDSSRPSGESQRSDAAAPAKKISSSAWNTTSTASTSVSADDGSAKNSPGLEFGVIGGNRGGTSPKPDRRSTAIRLRTRRLRD